MRFRIDGPSLRLEPGGASDEAECRIPGEGQITAPCSLCECMALCGIFASVARCLRSQHDYQVNLKAELEIRTLHQKVDHLLSHQWDRLVAIQNVQLEILSELEGKK